MSHDLKKCLECSKVFDAGLSQPGIESRRKFCCRACKTAYHNARHYASHTAEIIKAVIARRAKRGRPPKTEGVRAVGFVQMRITLDRKNSYIKAAAGIPLAAWIQGVCDSAAGYNSEKPDPATDSRNMP